MVTCQGVAYLESAARASLLKSPGHAGGDEDRRRLNVAVTWIGNLDWVLGT
jgi:hypothetical protein